MRLRCLAAVAGLLLCSFARAAEPKPAPAAGERVVLDVRAAWRAHLTWRTAEVRTAAGGLVPVEISGDWGKTFGSQPMERTPLPPADWAKPDFDDSAWLRLHGPVPAGSLHLALICLRGKFCLPAGGAAGPLTLSLGYRGGAVVYVNGVEVARDHLPAGPALSVAEGSNLETPAEDYPKDAYLRPDGKLLQNGFGDPAKFKDQFALRERKLAGVTIPAAALRPGVNVLAVELHRAPVSEVYFKGQSPNPSYCPWSMLALTELKLAGGGEAAGGAAAPAAGLRVWNASVLSKVDPKDAADANERLAPVRIVGCRNGAFAGQFVVGAANAVRKLKVTASGLAGPAGQIPAAAVQVRYVLDNPANKRRVGLDRLEDDAPAEVPAGAAQPVWLTVRVPADAKPGEYRGEAAVTADGLAAVKAPVELKVVEFSLPDSRKFCSHAGLMESPDSVAMKYNVPLWSEAHWALLDKTYQLLGQVGADDVFLPLICGTYLGNEQTMVRWVRQTDGGLKPDFTVAERYLDLVVKHLGRPAMVALYVWDRQGGMWGPTSRDLGEQKDAAKVTGFDPASGKCERIDAPRWGSPQSVPFWTPVFAGLRERLKQRGLDGSALIGVALDHRPPKSAVADLKQIAPGMKWAVHSHMAGGGTISQDMIGYGAHVWCSYRLNDPKAGRAKPWWTNPYVFTGFPRGGVGGVGPIYNEDLGVYRWLTEGLMASGHNGFGRVGVDFWPCRPGGGGRLADLIGGDAGDTSVTLHDSSEAVLAAGTAGPVSTIRFEMLREGVQEAEAWATIERGVADPAAKAKLGDELAARGQELLDGRVRAMRRAMGVVPGPGSLKDWALFAALPWQQDSEKLYALAGEIAAKLASK